MVTLISGIGIGFTTLITALVALLGGGIYLLVK